ncbi:hypothetical protein [Haladaptatus sp. DJG-WS-42]|uniref:hypothetical protein n=1 Tax=Haladaptatus sp. DJG-WS-42 TaxID=3120516 RepID=UPI0030D2EEAE
MVRLGDVVQLKFLLLGLAALFVTVEYATSDFELLARLGLFFALAFVVAGAFAHFARDVL